MDEQLWHIHHHASASGTLSSRRIVPKGRSIASRPCRNRRILLSTTFVRPPHHHGGCCFDGHRHGLRPTSSSTLFFQPCGTGALALSSTTLFIIVAHSKLASFIGNQLGSNSNLRRRCDTSLPSRPKCRQQRGPTFQTNFRVATVARKTQPKDTCLAVEVQLPDSSARRICTFVLLVIEHVVCSEGDLTRLSHSEPSNRNDCL